MTTHDVVAGDGREAGPRWALWNYETMSWDPLPAGYDPLTKWQWLASTEELQRDAFGHDIEGVRSDVARVADSLQQNSFALIVEIGEVACEFGWKRWSSDAPFVNRERVLDELVDVAHFLANMVVNLDCDDAEWAARYQAKQELNRRRMASGTYSAKKGSLAEGSDVG